MPHAEITQRDGADVIGVRTEWTDRELVKQVPSCTWDATAKIWTAPLSWAACVQLRGIFGERLTVGEKLIEWSITEMQHRITPSMGLREKITRTEGNFPDALYDFQTSGAAFLIATGDGGLLGDHMGLGKTPQILAALDALAQLDAANALPALVICPNSVKPDWVKQVNRWKINVTPYLVQGGAAARRKIIEEARRDPCALVITNTESVRLLSRLAPYGSISLKRCRECHRHGEEGLTSTRCEVHIKELNRFGFKTVIMDEAHALKDPKSKQTRAVWAVGHDPSVVRRWALTGTPVANNVGDLWSIMHFIAPHEFPVKSRFIDRYALQAWNAFGGLDIVGVNPQLREEFYKIIDPRFRRTPKELVLTQLPQVIRPTRWVDMIPKQERVYKELEQRLLARLDNGDVMIAPNSLIKALRLMQIASSYAEIEEVEQPVRETDECVRDYHRCSPLSHTIDCENRLKLVVHLREPSSKLDAVMEDIALLGTKQIVVAAESRQLIELLAKRLDKEKIRYGMLTGAIPDYDRQMHKQRFIDGAVQIMLLTIKAGGTGVDGLQVADTMLCLQRSWSMVSNIQLDARVNRIGSEVHDSVTIVDYVTRGTIETTLFQRLEEKWERLEEINRDRQRLTAAGIDLETRYNLDERERQANNAWLGAP